MMEKLNEKMNEVKATDNDDISLLKIDFDKEIPHFEYEKIAINLKSPKNIILLSRNEKRFYDLYLKMLSNDYMFYMHSKESSYFIKRKLLSTIWQRTDLIQYGELFYSLEEIAAEKVNRLAPRRLVVIFSSMPAEKDYFSPNIGVRCFTKNFPSITKHLLKNTRVMRIMDANLSHGSHYINTPNYPNFEDDVQGAIKRVMETYEIDKEDVVFYGGSKGGTGALYHSVLGDYKSVSVDQIISLKEYNELNSDSHFLKKFREVSLEKTLIEMANQEGMSNNKVIIGSPYVPFNYTLYSKLGSDNIKLLNLFDSNIKTHSEVSKNSVVEQVTEINNLLLSSKNLKKMNEELYEIVVENFSNFS